MKCPDEGQLLAYHERQLDAVTSAAINNHLATCRICQRRLSVLQEELSFCWHEMRPLLQQGAEAPVSGQYRVWEQLNNRKSFKGVEFLMKFKKTAAAAVVVLTLTGLLSIPSVKAAADSLLQVFRVNQISTVTLTPSDINHLRSALQLGDAEYIDVEKFGKIKTTGKPDQRPLASVEAAPFALRLPVSQSQPRLYLTDMPDTEFTLNVSNVNQLLKQLGSQKNLPATLEGQPFRLILPEMVTAEYEDYKVIQGISPEIQAPSGVDVAQIRDAIIDLPIWTPEVRMQLNAIQDWQHTLIIPDDGTNQAKEVRVGSQRGVYISMNESSGQLMWQEQGRLMIVEVQKGGSERAIEIAEALR